jgi:TPP-dependent pyruvate/acetoin dehydrogenase alpha subunit
MAYPIEDACEAMGLPRDFTKEMPFTMHGKRSVIGNGVPMAMGRAIAAAVRRATDVA